MAISAITVRFIQNNGNMIKLLPEKLQCTWFFISLLCFVVVLPFSQALVSIFGGIVLFTALAEDSFKNKIARFRKNKALILIPAIFAVYLISFLITYKTGNSLYDLQKTLFFVVIPISFIIGKPLTTDQKRFIFFAFALSVFSSSVVAMFNWLLNSYSGDFEVHRISLISHIRFSFQLILAFWFLLLFVEGNYTLLKNKYKALLLIPAFCILAFLFFQQSLTGIISFVASFLFYAGYKLFQFKFRYRILTIILLIGFSLTSIGYLIWVIHSFYDFEKVDKNTIDKRTSAGHYYTHDFDNKAVENGRFTYLYICNEELEPEWNKVSTIQFEETIRNGYPLYTTLYRYLTSKGLRKDAEGIKALTTSDIRNIENGVTNYIFHEKKYTIYPRIYQTIWEYYMYSVTGDPNYQSFSQRIEFMKAALTIIKDNFWFGVGAGNWKEEFKNAYVKNNSVLKEELFASSHNQYLNYLVKFGITGTVLIMFFIVYPVIKSRSYRDPLFLIFLVFLFFANFGDSNFESHMGSSFFLFFYCLFVIQPGSQYLKLSK